MILNNAEKKCLIDNLEWVVTDMKHKSDEIHLNLEEGSQGGYSKELTKLICLLDSIKKTKTVETTGCHRGMNVVNCRDFECVRNRSGICLSGKVTLENVGSEIVGRLKCVEAEAEIEEEKQNAL